MNVLCNEALDELLGATQTPCFSLYQPTHRHFPDNQQDRIRYQNLVRELKRSVGEQRSEAEDIFARFEALSRDAHFWNHTLDGLAVLASPGLFRVFRLPQSVHEFATVAPSFHLKPLWRFLQSAERYQVLALTLDKCRLFEGNRDSLTEIELAEDFPRTLTLALGDELTEPHQIAASYGGVGVGSHDMYHSHGGRTDEVENDTTRFFRAVDRAVLEHHSRPSSLPLLLAALPEHHHVFRKVSHNPFLTEEGIGIDPEAVTDEELRLRAWHVFEAEYEARLLKTKETFEAARTKGLGSDNLHEVAAAAAAGRVATLLIESERRIAGKLDPVTGRLSFEEPQNPEVDDLLDDLGELVAAKKGQILVVSKKKMELSTGLAAIYRY